MAEKKEQARLSEAEREITRYQQERQRWIDYTIDLQRIIEALCDRRGLAEPVSTARHHYSMAQEYLSSKKERHTDPGHDKLVAALKALLDANDAVQIALCDGPDVPGFEPGELGRAQVHVSEAESIARAALASLQTQEEGGV